MEIIEMAHYVDDYKTTKHNFQRFSRIWKNAHEVTVSEEVDDIEPFLKSSIIPMMGSVSDLCIHKKTTLKCKVISKARLWEFISFVAFSKPSVLYFLNVLLIL